MTLNNIYQKTSKIVKVHSLPYTLKKMTQSPTSTGKFEKIAEIMNIFTPSKPINIKELFSGRYSELRKAQEAILEKGSHLIIYGDRGVGKTSLANILRAIITGTAENPTNIHCTYIGCNAYDTFEEMWENSLNQLTTTIEVEEAKSIGFINTKKEQINQTITLGQILKYKNPDGIKVSGVANFLNEYNSHLVFIFDEFDRIESKETKEKFSYLIKTLSDINEKVTIILVGIAEDISTIVEKHESVERCLKQVLLPRMSKSELEEIVNKGLTYVNMNCENSTKNKIIDFAEGFPQYIHLLCKYSAIAAIERNSTVIEELDLKSSIEKAIDEVQESIKRKYRSAIETVTQTNIFKCVLLACAFVETNEHRLFTSKDIQNILCKILGKNMTVKQYGYHLGQLCSEERGKVLQREGRVSQYKYKFRNPLLKAFIKIKAFQEDIKI